MVETDRVSITMAFLSSLFGKKEESNKTTFRSQWIMPYTGPADKSHLATRSTVGLKGINLIELANLDLPVAPGLILKTNLIDYYSRSGHFPESFEPDLRNAIHFLEAESGRSFVDPYNPLLMSIRNSPTHNVPIETGAIMNLGLNDTAVAGLAALYQDPRFAWDCYRRLIFEYATSTQGVPDKLLIDALEEYKENRSIKNELELTAEDWQAVVRTYKGIIEKTATVPFPQDTYKQLMSAIETLIKSWHNFEHREESTFIYPKAENEHGLAILIQSMVYGNRNNNSGVGTLFTRDPNSGERGITGHFVVNSQGRFINVGRKQIPLTEQDAETWPQEEKSLEDISPGIVEELRSIAHKLEQHYRDMISITFVVQDGEIYITETRSGKRASVAAVKIAADMVEDNLIGRSDALTRINPLLLEQVLKPDQGHKEENDRLFQGKGASPGSVSGRLVFSAELAEELASQGMNVILCRNNTSKKDIHGINAASGVITIEGDNKSHAAVTARSMGRPCVVGAKGVKIDEQSERLLVGERTLKSGDIITIDGQNGWVSRGTLHASQPIISKHLDNLISWGDQYRRMKSYANVSSLEEIDTAISMGAEGIGLVRTEFLIRQPSVLPAIQKLVLTTAHDEKMKLLSLIEPEFETVFDDIFKRTKDLPVTIRLLDSPLHSFMPNPQAEPERIEVLSEQTGLSKEHIINEIDRSSQQSAHLGLRGCRIGINFPQFYATMTKAIFKSALKYVRSENKQLPLKIVVPFVASMHEMRYTRDLIDKTAQLVAVESGQQLPPYKVGAMIEIPRAAIRGSEIGEYSDFLAFGTGDLTQLSYGLALSDTRKFMPDYIRRHVFDHDPFHTIDRVGLGEIMSLCIERARQTKPEIEFGLCGPHGGDPKSIDFCEYNGMDYISCDPPFLPIVRLAAAQTALKYDRPEELLDKEAS